MMSCVKYYILNHLGQSPDIVSLHLIKDLRIAKATTKIKQKYKVIKQKHTRDCNHILFTITRLVRVIRN